MPKGFLPNSDAALRDWAKNFAAKILPDPGAYGLSAEDAEQFASLSQAYAAALQTCLPNIRSTMAVVEKNQVRAALRSDARRLALIVKSQSQVDDAQRVGLGLSVRPGRGVKTPAPAAAPLLTIRSSVGLSVFLRLCDRDVPNRRGKPPATLGATLFRYIGPAAPSLIGEWTMVCNTTRTRLRVDFPHDVPPGAQVWFTAYWLNARLESGPLADPISINLPGGMVANSSMPAMLRAA